MSATLGLPRGHDEQASYVAAPLSHGSNPNSNMAGRRREDDENLVVANTLKSQRGRGWSYDPEATYAFHPTGGGAKGLTVSEDEAPGTGTGTGGTIAVASSTGVRRLTPTECERLQALPDGWTDFGPDSRRYAALGDAVTANVSEWIGRRLIGV